MVDVPDWGSEERSENLPVNRGRYMYQKRNPIHDSKAGAQMEPTRIVTLTSQIRRSIHAMPASGDAVCPGSTGGTCR